MSVATTLSRWFHRPSGGAAKRPFSKRYVPVLEGLERRDLLSFTASISGLLASTFEGHPLTLSGSGSGGTGRLTYLWSFGDGGTSTSQNVNHAWDAKTDGSGHLVSYVVTLTVTDSALPRHHTAQATANLAINPSPPIVANVGGPYTVVVGATLQPTPPVVVNPNPADARVNDLLYVNWGTDNTWPGGTVSNPPSHVYTAAGIYTVTYAAQRPGLNGTLPGVQSWFQFQVEVTPAPSAPTTYYVNSQAGNDQNNGTSQTTPWRSLNRVNQGPASGSYQPGDSILLKGGLTFVGHLFLGHDTPSYYPNYLQNLPQQSSIPITISSYGAGRAQIITDGPASDIVVYLDGSGGVHVSNLIINATNGNITSKVALAIDNPTGSNSGYTPTMLNDVYLNNLDVYGFVGNFINGLLDPGAGIVIGGLPGTGFTNVSVTNSTIHNGTNATAGLFFTADVAPDGLPVGGTIFGGVYVGHNTIHDLKSPYASGSLGNGVLAFNCTTGTFERNYIYNLESPGGAGMDFPADTDLDVRYNIINNIATNNGWDGEGMALDIYALRNRVHSNLIMNCRSTVTADPAPGYALRSASVGLIINTTNVSVSYIGPDSNNILYNNIVMGCDGGAVAFYSALDGKTHNPIPFDGNVVVNNIFVANGNNGYLGLNSAAVWLYDAGSSITNSVIANNIIEATPGARLLSVVDTSLVVNTRLNGNLYYYTGMATDVVIEMGINWDGTPVDPVYSFYSYAHLSQWQQDWYWWGAETFNGLPTYARGNPLFLNPTTPTVTNPDLLSSGLSGYMLQSKNLPALNHGIDPALLGFTNPDTSDFFGHPRQGNHSIGFDEID